MDDPPPSLQPLLHSPPGVPTTAAVDFNPTAELPLPPNSTVNGEKASIIKTKNKKKRKKKLAIDASDAPSSSTSSSCSTSHSVQRRVRVGSRQRNPRFLIGSARQKEGDVEALALPLGMSIAAVVAQVLEKKDATGDTISVAHLSKICTCAVRESLANVFGDKFDAFVRNFEKSFRSTLMTLRLINESSRYTGEHLRCLNKESNYLDVMPPISLNKENGFTCSCGVKACQSDVVQHTISSEEHFGTLEGTEQNTRTVMNRLPILHNGEINQQLACVSPLPHSLVNRSRFSTFEKSVIEQTRSNNLKTFEISLTMKKLQLKEKQLALDSASNFLGRCKLSMGFSKASFKEEKFKNELEETRRAELLKKCIDCLVAGLLVMLVSIAYGAYVYAHNRITEATSSCKPSEDSKSWWTPKPMASFNSGLQVLWCQVNVVSRMLFGMLMILAIAYLLVQRSAANSTQTMPVTFVLLLGVGCGFAGKLCIDTLGGSGYHWLIYWEVLCLVHFFSNICTSALFILLYGPITTVSQEFNKKKKKTIFAYWIRRVLFYATMLLFLPLLCGLIPFASFTEWIDHFSIWVIDFLPITN